MIRFNDKRYHSVDYELKNHFHTKIVKLPIDAGFTCPTRDGSKGTKGCIFCLQEPSANIPILNQMENMSKILSNKWKNAKYIAYFQSNSNTYASVKKLENLFETSLQFPDTVGLAIATRADCLDEEKVKLLNYFSQKTYLWVELGLQTSDEKVARFFGRGYSNNSFEKTINLLNKYNIKTVAHTIINLPKSNLSDVLDTYKYLINCKIWGIKIHMLNILKNTPLEEYYKNNPFYLVTADEYIGLVCDILEILPPEMVIHRITGDGKKNDLIAPRWILNKRYVLNGVDKELKRRNSYQGIRYKEK